MARSIVSLILVPLLTLGCSKSPEKTTEKPSTPQTQPTKAAATKATTPSTSSSTRPTPSTPAPMKVDLAAEKNAQKYIQDHNGYYIQDVSPEFHHTAPIQRVTFEKVDLSTIAIEPFKKLARFHLLVLIDTTNTDSFSQKLRELPQLTSLEIHGGDATAKTWAALTQSPNIKSLELQRREMNNDAEWKQLNSPTLTTLILDQCKSTNAAFNQIRLPELVTCKLYNNSSFSAAGCREFFQHSSKLRLLEIKNCPLSDQGIEAISQVTSLEKFVVQQSACSDACLQYVARLKHLQHLELSQSPSLTGEKMNELASLAQLRELHLSQNAISDRGLAEISKIKSLRLIDISDSKVTDLGVKSLEGHGELRALWAAKTTLSKSIFSSAMRIPKLELLWVDQTKIKPADLPEAQKLIPKVEVRLD